MFSGLITKAALIAICAALSISTVSYPFTSYEPAEAEKSAKSEEIEAAVEETPEPVIEVIPTPAPTPTPTPEPTPEPAPWYTEEELEILAIIIYQEAGGNAATDDTRLMVGNVFLNRVSSELFPNTFQEVATQKAQYGTLHWTGIQWPERAAYDCEAHAVQRAYDIAVRLLDGERVLPDDTIWQAEFPQGTETVVYQDGLYFCR